MLLAQAHAIAYVFEKGMGSPLERHKADDSYRVITGGGRMQVPRYIRIFLSRARESDALRWPLLSRGDRCASAVMKRGGHLR